MSILTKPYFQARKNNGVLFEPDADTVLWLPGQDDAYSATIRDRSGAGNNGAITGATWTRNSQGLWYLDFDGSDDTVIMGNTATLNFSTGDLTLVIWIKCGENGRTQVLFNKEDAGGQLNFERLADNTIRFFCWASGYQAQIFTNAITDTNWHQISASRIGAALAISRDGVEDDTGSGTIKDVDSTGDLGMGATDIDTRNFKGGLALGRAIKGTGWTAAQRTASFNQERHLFNV
ncbi:hypothetical protein LCGC14_1502330 [marine sediment metagenome]|uniref:Laminin G domain-containing protein n=1 Tax=marine sediment metagenome TaxID=412755 RepID=A0A0F9J499_9ZZZZ